MERCLGLQGCVNFRDIGGYRSGNGKTVRWGTFYRSGSLERLTEADFDVLAQRRIRTVGDFRSGVERMRAPTAWRGQGPEILCLEIGPDPSEHRVREILARQPDARVLRSYMLRSYQALPETAAPRFRAMLGRILDAGLPALVHCAAGKDRTGLFTAFLLTLLDVPYRDVLDDYLLTNDLILGSGTLDRVVRALQVQFSGGAITAETLRPVLGVESAYLDAAFQAVRERYGSFEEYADTALGVNNGGVARLRELFLE